MPWLEVDGEEVECVRLSRDDARWAFYRCLRFLAPKNGAVRLSWERRNESIHEIAYAVWTWSRPRSLRKGIPEF